MSALYKTTTADHKGPYSGFDFSPYLPRNGKPGKWLPKVEALEMCERGYHFCEIGDLLDWLDAEIYEVETRGETLEGDDKCAAQQIRLVRKCENWNERTARLFACNCAEHVQGFWRKRCPDDNRPQAAIDTARKFANGEATAEEMAAAWAAAWAAAGDAARAAAWAAARDTVWDTVWAAARAAAWAAARDTARAAEEQWQLERLMQYLNGEVV